MKEKLIKDIENADLPGYEKKYIVAVVDHVDSKMSELEKGPVDFSTAINAMIEIVHNVNNCSTGVGVIDNIVDLRKQAAYDVGHDQATVEYVENNDFRTSNETYGFVRNYIGVISPYGGLFKYVCEQYTPEIEMSVQPTNDSEGQASL